MHEPQPFLPLALVRPFGRRSGLDSRKVGNEQGMLGDRVKLVHSTQGGPRAREQRTSTCAPRSVRGLFREPQQDPDPQETRGLCT